MLIAILIVPFPLLNLPTLLFGILAVSTALPFLR
jgi:hypothetical protein